MTFSGTTPDINLLCSLCGTAAETKISLRDRNLFRCVHCGLVFADRASHLPREKAKARYLLHENNIQNQGYRDFLNRAVQIARPFLSAGSRGLDYGCGPEAALSKLLTAEGFLMSNYDLFFYDHPLSPPYDFIFSTECFEHFAEPRQDIQKVLSLLRPGGILAIMTELWDNSTDFKRWHYASDPTHVSFYSQAALAYICEAFKIRCIAGDGKQTFVFRKNENL